jgi:hypothetical protein
MGTTSHWRLTKIASTPDWSWLGRDRTIAGKTVAGPRVRVELGCSGILVAFYGGF